VPIAALVPNVDRLEARLRRFFIANLPSSLGRGDGARALIFLAAITLS
jgi:hypothetical protein